MFFNPDVLRKKKKQNLNSLSSSSGPARNWLSAIMEASFSDAPIRDDVQSPQFCTETGNPQNHLLQMCAPSQGLPWGGNESYVIGAHWPQTVHIARKLLLLFFTFKQSLLHSSIPCPDTCSLICHKLQWNTKERSGFVNCMFVFCPTKIPGLTIWLECEWRGEKPNSLAHEAP